jgi:hypothetical protein
MDSTIDHESLLHKQSDYAVLVSLRRPAARLVPGSMTSRD